MLLQLALQYIGQLTDIELRRGRQPVTGREPRRRGS